MSIASINGLLGSGTGATRDFYNQLGWKRENGRLVDLQWYGPGEVGPIRQEMHDQRIERIRGLLGGPGLDYIECGCGGSPAVVLSDLCSHITAVDFSATGLVEAAKTLRKTGVPFETVEADMTRLPFPNETFDAAYSAQAIFHIEDPRGQAAAFREIMRVVKPGGVAVFVLANPFPLLFPIRAVRRILASLPGVNALLNRLRAKPPIPFRPMPLGWMRQRLAAWGDVQITGYRMASTWCNQKLTEESGIGRIAWKLMRRIETHHPRLAARLGCYVTIAVRKHAAAIAAGGHDATHALSIARAA